MSELRLVGNYIDELWNKFLDHDEKAGHFQVVFYASETDQREIEVLPSGPGIGTWTYPDNGKPQDHLEHTHEHTNRLWYSFAKIDDLGGRSAENVWKILEQVHSQFNDNGKNIPYYAVSENSNSYATTVLSVVGIDINKYASAATPPNTVFPGQGMNVLENVKDAISLNLKGTDGNDIIHTGLRDDILKGLAGDDHLQGGSGNDILIGGPGGDLLDGDDGIDTADYSSSSAAVTINLATGPATGGDAQGDALFSIEKLIGSQYDDKFIDSSGDNIIAGGAGHDQFTFSAGNDTVTDFDPNEDSIYLQSSTTISGAYLNDRDTVLTYSGGTVTLANFNLGPRVAAGDYPWLQWSDIPWGTLGPRGVSGVSDTLPVGDAEQSALVYHHQDDWLL